MSPSQQDAREALASAEDRHVAEQSTAEKRHEGEQMVAEAKRDEEAAVTAASDERTAKPGWPILVEREDGDGVEERLAVNKETPDASRPGDVVLVDADGKRYVPSGAAGVYAVEKA